MNNPEDRLAEYLRNNSLSAEDRTRIDDEMKKAGVTDGPSLLDYLCKNISDEIDRELFEMAGKRQ